MKLVSNFESLLNGLTSVSSVVEDVLSSEDMKNVIFQINKSGRVNLIGINQLITCKKAITDDSLAVIAEDSEFNDAGVHYMQIKSKEIITFLNTFKSLRRTKATEVNLEIVQGKIKASVIEEDLDDSSITHLSNWMFDNIPIKPKLMTQLGLVFPEEGASTVETQAILFYTANLLPIMQNGTNLFSRLIFGEDKVVAFNAAFNTLVNNTLPETFQKISLSYRAIAFMKDIICNSPIVQVNRTEQHLCFKTDDLEAFLTYDNKIAEYEMYVKMFQKDHAITFDRQYFKDVLKRLSIGNDTIEFKIAVQDGCVDVKNAKFHQTIPILHTKGMDGLGEIKFKIMPDVLNKAIIGDDSQFSSETFMYIVPNANNSYTMIITDDSGMWFSTASIR